ncbi:MAG: hypothetical protein H7066_21220, partial [Cytophagaceae bacterium]|nr:hypothetical protein [Gemmatimonadaceae bacterium]
MVGLPVLAWSIGAMAAAPTDTPAPDTDAIAWTAPPECPERASVAARIYHRLGRVPTTGEVDVDATIVRDERHGYTLHLELAAGTRSEAREVHDPSCDALADAAALLVVAVLAQAAPVA